MARPSAEGRLDYGQFLERKSQLGTFDGFEPIELPDALFEFQAALVGFALRKGKSAILSATGTGKTAMQLAWSDNVVRHTNGNVLVLTPLAVSSQTVREAEKFGIKAQRSPDGTVHNGITVTNYERLHYFDPKDFSGLVCDEAACLKSFDGTRRQAITEFMRKLPYRLLCTATPAPNDYIELGTLSEALGELGYMDMLGRFFKNDQNTSKPMVYRHRGQNFAKLDERAKWRFKGHAEQDFWRWVASWARALRKPSDLGFDDDGFILPPLTEHEHIVESREAAPGRLFDVVAVGLQEQREERRRTITERCEKVAALVNDTGEHAIVWCHLNAEGVMLDKLIPDAVEVSGRDSDDAKEDKLRAFTEGETRVLISKPVIGAWGLNWQHCNHVTFFPSHSFEQYFQAVRRCWRFGQTRPVRVDIVATEGDVGVKANMQRKAEQAERMLEALVSHMNDALRVETTEGPTEEAIVPSWV